MPRNQYRFRELCLDVLPYFSISDNELSMLLHETSNFDDLIFNPLHLNSQNDQTTESTLLDKQLEKTMLNCKYYLPEKFKNIIKGVDSSNLSIMNLNMRSIPKNFDSFIQLNNILDYNFDIIAFTETWLTEQNESKHLLDGYTPIYNSRKNRDGGGVCLFISKKLNFKIRNDLILNNNDCESLTLEILNGKDKNSLITVIY